MNRKVVEQKFIKIYESKRYPGNDLWRIIRRVGIKEEGVFAESSKTYSPLFWRDEVEAIERLASRFEDKHRNYIATLMRRESKVG